MTDIKWISCKCLLPKNGEIVLTKIDDIRDGPRNEQKLKRQDHLWFDPDGLTYVYYTPTHWAEL